MAIGNENSELQDYKFHIFGNGWIANLVKDLLVEQNHRVTISDCRIEDREAVTTELRRIQPTRVINAAGYHGYPNADWCEGNKETVIRSNVLGAINVVDCCFLMDIHVTHFGSACIFECNADYPLDGPGFSERDPPNFAGSFYSHSKMVSEKAIQAYPNVCILRLRQPIAADLHYRNFVSKLIGYQKLVSIPNSGSILTNLLPGAILLSQHKDTGIYNFTSPGAFTNNDVMSMFRDVIRPGLTWVNFTLEDQSKVLKAPRSSARLDSTKLVKKLASYGYEVKDCHVAMRECFEEMKQQGYV